jgi:hypothetical protein
VWYSRVVATCAPIELEGRPSLCTISHAALVTAAVAAKATVGLGAYFESTISPATALKAVAPVAASFYPRAARFHLVS